MPNCLYRIILRQNGSFMGIGPVLYSLFDDKGTYNTIADDRTKNIVSFMDQDNKTFTPNYYTCIEEDNNGQIWIGTSSGPIVITNPDHVF